METGAAGKAFAAANPLVPGKPSLAAPDGWTLTASKVAKTFTKLVQLKIWSRKSGFFYTGDFIAAKRNPSVRIIAAKAGQEHIILHHSWPTREVGDVRGYVRGNFRPFWSPDGDRMVWAVFRNTVQEKTSSTTQRASFVLGALGPRILVVDRGAGLHAARMTAVLLGKKSLPVTRVYPQPDRKQDAHRAKSRVLYVGESAKTVATSVGRALSGDVTVVPAPSNHARRSEADVIVELAGTQAPKLSMSKGQPFSQSLGWSAGPSGRHIARLCRWFVGSRMSMNSATQEEIPEDKLDIKALVACSKKMSSLTLSQRQEIADCANACGDIDGIPECYEEYGTGKFPSCRGESEGESERDEAR